MGANKADFHGVQVRIRDAEGNEHPDTDSAFRAGGPWTVSAHSGNGEEPSFVKGRGRPESHWVNPKHRGGPVEKALKSTAAELGMMSPKAKLGL
jgi:hypothetical protein